jgi:putative DNA primase/helicase
MNFDNIPRELKELDRWVCWRVEQRDGKPTKVPINPQTGNRAMSDNPSTWSDFVTAVDRMQGDNLPGIGFMLGGGYVGGRYVGVDMDHCRNPETGELTEEAWDIIHMLKSYTEISPSGTGIHVICKGTLPAGSRRHGHIEMYDCGRYFTVTGEVLTDER